MGTWPHSFNIFMLLFFMAFAQLNSGIGGDGMEWKIPGYCLPAALMALVCFVPRFIVDISGNSNLLYEQSPAEYCDLAIALFILCVVFTRVGKKEPAAVNTQAPIAVDVGLPEDNTKAQSDSQQPAEN